MKITKFVVMMLIGIITSSTAFAAEASTEVNFPDGTKMKIAGKPTVAPAKAEAKKSVEKKVAQKKKKKGVKRSKKAAAKVEAVETPVAAAALSQTAQEVPVGKTNQNLIKETERLTDVTKSAQALTVTASDKPVDLTKSAKSKSVSVKFNFNPFKIFMPDAITTTALSDHLVLIAGMRVMNGTNTADQPNGFKTVASDSTGTNSDFAVAAKIWRVGAEYDLTPDETDLPTSWNGSSLNGMHLTTSNKLIGKLYALDTRNYSLTLGLGAEYTALSGAVSMGGFKFVTEGEGWTPVVQFGGEYHLNQWWTLGLVYERSNIRITTKVPGAPDLITTRNDRMIFRLSLGLF